MDMAALSGQLVVRYSVSDLWFGEVADCCLDLSVGTCVPVSLVGRGACVGRRIILGVVSAPIPSPV